MIKKLKNTKNIILFFLEPLIDLVITYYYGVKNRHIDIPNNTNNQKRIFYFMLPTHGNIGDQAIALATLQMLKEQFNDYQIITVNDVDTLKKIKTIKNIIKPFDIIFLHGGGNMGNLYGIAERERIQVVRNFPHNRIVIMTQTANFSNSLRGRIQLKRSMKAYNSHRRLIIFAREERTFKFMKKEFYNAEIKLLPDIVFYLTKENNDIAGGRNFITTCIRNDQESILKSPEEVLKDIGNIDDEVFIYDTCVTRKIDSITRNLEVNSLINQFRRSKIVITDRMHGMVISAITQTPCIVTKSLDSKIIGTYQWIKDLNYVLLVDKFDLKTLRYSINRLNSIGKRNRVNIKEKYLMHIRDLVLED